ncbi:hypothetical protein NKH69_34180 [Mesorhizobium sp. M0976]|uniref:hypothetical protein n=1 Tax=Mesorhizobium sp. M0976 TaxID=2957038 RepID=UPI00333D74B3
MIIGMAIHRVAAEAEVIHRRGPWRSFEAVEFATLEWVEWFDNRKRHAAPLVRRMR